MPKMRAKMYVMSANEQNGSTRLLLGAVCKKDGYPEDGTDENNTFAKWTPQANMEMVINNPDLVGTFEQGQEYYLDFTLAE